MMRMKLKFNSIGPVRIYKKGQKKTNKPNNFETFSCNRFMAKEILSFEFDPEVNFYENISSLDTDDFSVKHSINNKNYFSMLHVNIRSVNKHFENFNELFSSPKLSFSSLCLLETWRDSLDKAKDQYVKILFISDFEMLYLSIFLIT